MPIGRYFLYIGSLLLALLFVADWYAPPISAEQTRSEVDHPTIRLHSTYKWPDAVVFDTTQPTIVPPPMTTAAAPAPPPPRSATSARDAYAMATEPAARPAEAVKPAKPHVRRTRTARAPAGAGNDMFGFGYNMFAPPRREAFASRNQGFGSRGFWPMSW